MSYFEPVEWLWDFGSTGSSGEKYPAYVFPTSDTYEVCLTVSNNNGEDTYCRTLNLGTDAKERSGEKIGITFFPNPAKEVVNIVLSEGYLPKKGIVVFYNIIGQVKLSQPVLAGWNSVRLDRFSPGIYFYEVKDGSERIGGGKLVVE